MNEGVSRSFAAACRYAVVSHAESTILGGSEVLFSNKLFFVSYGIFLGVWMYFTYVLPYLWPLIKILCDGAWVSEWPPI